jgi:hypothetical protein
MKFLTSIKGCSLAFLCVFSSISYSQEILIGNDAEALFQGAQIVRTGEHSTAPSFVKFRIGKELDLDDFKGWIKKNFKLEEQIDFSLINIENDKLGHKHYPCRELFILSLKKIYFCQP